MVWENYFHYYIKMFQVEIEQNKKGISPTLHIHPSIAPFFSRV